MPVSFRLLCKDERKCRVSMASPRLLPFATTRCLQPDYALWCLEEQRAATAIVAFPLSRTVNAGLFAVKMNS